MNPIMYALVILWVVLQESGFKMKKIISSAIMGLAITFAVWGEFKYNFYYEDLIIMAMLVAIYFKKGEI